MVRMNNFLMHGQAFAHHVWCQRGFLSQHRYRARINLLADTPNMQIGDASATVRIFGFDHFPNFIDHG